VELGENLFSTARRRRAVGEGGWGGVTEKAILTLSEVLPPEERNSFRAMPRLTASTEIYGPLMWGGRRGAYYLEMTEEEKESMPPTSGAVEKKTHQAKLIVNDQVVSQTQSWFPKAALYRHAAWRATGVGG